MHFSLVDLLFGGMIQKFNLVMLGLKLVILVFLVGWVRAHIGGGRLGTFIMLFLGYLLLFRYWALTGPIAILYLLAITGITGLAMDIVFTHQQYNPFSKGARETAGEERSAEYLNNPAYGMQNKYKQNVFMKMFRK